MGSDEQSDNYQFSIVLPTDPKTPVIRAISYTGADHTIIYQQKENEKEVAITISKSMESVTGHRQIEFHPEGSMPTSYTSPVFGHALTIDEATQLKDHWYYVRIRRAQ